LCSGEINLEDWNIKHNDDMLGSCKADDYDVIENYNCLGLK